MSQPLPAPTRRRPPRRRASRRARSAQPRRPCRGRPSTDNIAVTGYRLFQGGSQVGTSATTSFGYTGLTCETTYTLGVAAVDAAGNVSGTATKSVTTAACPDTTPPSTPTGLATSAVGATSATLSWTASTDNVGVTGYRLFQGGNQVGTSATTSYSYTGLTCGTTYTLGVVAVDAAGNVSGHRDEERHDDRLCGHDATLHPTGLATGAVGATSPTLSWTASTDNVGVTGYRLFQNGSQVGTAMSPGYSFGGLTWATTYTLGVAAVDAAGNVSGTASVSGSTTACTSGGSASLYVAQSALGSGDGSSCGNARAVSFFNSAANWGSGKAIAPGTTVGLCGTITSTLDVMGSGAAGAPVTVLFTAGAKISQPVCGPCIYADGRSYITIDGGGSGQILSSANGTTFANHSNTTGVSFDPCDHCTVENLQIGPLYQHTSPTDENVGYDHTQQHAIKASGSYVSFHDNNVHDVGWALDFYFQGGDGIQDHIYNNNVWNVDHGFIFTGSSPTGPVFFNNNHVHDFANWDDNNDENHHDGIHCFGLNFSNGALYIYNNVFDGNMGTNLTGAIYGETGCATSSARFYMFNNVVKLSNDNCCGGVGMAVGHTYTWNNTVLSYSSSASNSGLLGCYQGAGAPARSCSLENNVASTSNQLANWTNASFDSGSPDYNVYSDCQGTSCFSADGAGECGQNYSLSQFANYRSCTGAEAHSIAVASAKLNADGSPQAGSPVLAAGTNLTALCTGDLTPLCSDINGRTRPTSGPWDAGAYQASP